VFDVFGETMRELNGESVERTTREVHGLLGVVEDATVIGDGEGVGQLDAEVQSEASGGVGKLTKE
jgi:hypothetical protein